MSSNVGSEGGTDGAAVVDSLMEADVLLSEVGIAVVLVNCSKTCDADWFAAVEETVSGCGATTAGVSGGKGFSVLGWTVGWVIVA